ncbi:3-hydroxyacyl-CoA dehydrogenase NAD-binding domain-containing protein [Suttonella ornithocola]|uniref:enoyl-CoA hydratase n=1 Tax=Suttonella ornithocola TaxID=279832 RepID=A0A380MUL2_9GAMM|nr:3-hydroxyacyl-CoA dehydrogenase NAD-binding domain-containing protein [Suttonella ornithocola]SUO96290.1 Fatty acid oxidation complex subunit alpha [Suttonella ornithocola]
MSDVQDFPTFKHWQLKAEESVLYLILDKENASANTLNASVLEAFEDVVEWLETKSSNYQALFLQSGKSSGFIAGADIEEIRESRDSVQLSKNITRIARLFERFEALPIVKVALIDGFCLGGGLELALCCDYRVITKRSALGLPEVKLGLHPGFGGTARLPQLISPIKALPLMLQGNSLRGKKAVQVGIADACVNEANELVQAAKKLSKQGKRSRTHWLSKVFSVSALRRLIANKMREQVAKKARPEHYPAPFAIIDLWAEHGGSYQTMMHAETSSFVRLRATSQSESLIRLYFLQERLKAFGKNDAQPIKHLHVIGAGVMGGDIAAWAAMNGVYTSLSDLSQETLDKALARGYKLFDKKCRDKDDNAEAKMRLRSDIDGWGVDKADLIIETAVEKLEIKQKIFQDLMNRASTKAILATNTSSLKLETIAEGLSEPERLVGIHFFNPVSKMPLVEIVKKADTPLEVIERSAKFVNQIKRLPLPVKSSPGFLVNRVLVPYLYEALLLYREGIEAAAIDQAAEAFGMPMGPIELADNVGLDVCLHILETMKDFLPEAQAKELSECVNAGKSGKKSGEGFYVYEKGKPRKSASNSDSETQNQIQQRLIMAYLNACAWCLRNEIVEDADLLDAGCVFGTGFAPFRGGPMYYAKSLGFGKVVEQLNQLEEKYGERFTPDAWWSKQS